MRLYSPAPKNGKAVTPIRTKRVYEEASPSDGSRVLVDRLWPRGIRKSDLGDVEWLRELAPSHALRRWFAHDPERWREFRKRYFEELEKKRELWEPLIERARRGTVTLLFGARDEEHNQAVALRSFLVRRLAARRRKK